MEKTDKIGLLIAYIGVIGITIWLMLSVSAIQYSEQDYKQFVFDCVPSINEEAMLRQYLGYNQIELTEDNIFQRCLEASWNVPILRQRLINLRTPKPDRGHGKNPAPQYAEGVIQPPVQTGYGELPIVYDEFDFNQDGAVDTLDITGFNNQFKQCLADSCQDLKFDCNEDGWIDSLDISVCKDKFKEILSGN